MPKRATIIAIFRMLALALCAFGLLESSIIC
jgi:hypothetical protein